MKKPAKQLLFVLLLLSGILTASAQTLIPRYSFIGGNDGGDPVAGLVQASDGNLYGTTFENGTNGYGAIFRISTSGVMTPLYSFTDGHDGAHPDAGLIQASDGNLYGTAEDGGTNGDGTVFRMTTKGVLTPLYSFTGGHDGGDPRGGLVQATDGNLYGTTADGGTNFDGTIFRITTNGALTSLHSFIGSHDGDFPEATLVQAVDGNLYGTTYEGGTNGYGAIFRITTTNGLLTPLYSFTNGSDGAYPVAGLVQANDGNLYGTTEDGGTNGYGTIFRITTNNIFTPLYSFTDGNDGGNPEGTLVQTSDGNLYGTDYEGGTKGYGVIFRITTSGAMTPLYSFTDGQDGADPLAGVIEANNANLYGTSPGGGTGNGTVFELTAPSLAPPTINILLNGRQSILSWPSSATNFILQSATNLLLPNWITVSNTPAATSLTVTNVFPSQYFRLAYP
jgi:uncharacterized repeat protein (TIGR03803 family)